MDCLGPECAQALIEWLKTQRDEQISGNSGEPATANANRQGSLFRSAFYQEDASAIRSTAELAGALEHLEFSIFRRYQNQLTKAERARLDNRRRIADSLIAANKYPG